MLVCTNVNPFGIRLLMMIDALSKHLSRMNWCLPLPEFLFSINDIANFIFTDDIKIYKIIDSIRDCVATVLSRFRGFR